MTYMVVILMPIFQECPNLQSTTLLAYNIASKYVLAVLKA